MQHGCSNLHPYKQKCRRLDNCIPSVSVAAVRGQQGAQLALCVSILLGQPASCAFCSDLPPTFRRLKPLYHYPHTPPDSTSPLLSASQHRQSMGRQLLPASHTHNQTSQPFAYPDSHPRLCMSPALCHTQHRPRLGEGSSPHPLPTHLCLNPA